MGEREDRRQRTHDLLDVRGIPWLASLPMIETEDEAVFRPVDDIISRVRCLLAISWAAIHRDLSLAQVDIERWQLANALTPDERKFLSGEKKDERNFINFSWQCEAIVPLIWVAGLHDDLYFPDQTLDLASLREFIHGVTPDDVSAAVQPSAAEILDEADLIYRLHWATRQAGLDGRAVPGGLDPGVVVERHRALNWLIGYEESAEWDDVTTDT